jgi:hypothetical protein
MESRHFFAGFIVLFALFGCGRDDGKPATLNDFVSSIVSSGNSSVQMLEKVMTVEALGMQKEYFEKTYGPAKRLIGNGRQYDIGLCNVIIIYDKNDSIESVELLNISKDCTFDGKNIYLQSRADKITYSELFGVAFDWNAKLSCYTMCGNAADPEYGAYVDTPRVYGFVEFDATTNYEVAQKASDDVYEYFKKKYPDEELIGGELGKIPATEYNKIWFEKFKDIRLTGLKFGYNLQK